VLLLIRTNVRLLFAVRAAGEASSALAAT
jgi:hypothetical protein